MGSLCDPAAGSAMMSSPVRMPSFPPSPAPSAPSSGRRLVVALTVGAVGGATFAWIGLPLPWMLGAMATVTVLALAGGQPSVPRGLRFVMLAVVGVMLGSNVTPDLLDRLDGWGLSLSGLLLFVALTPWLGAVVFRRLGGHNRVTAYFAAAPGGINEMVFIGGALGGDERTIALSHSLRILIVVFTVPVWFRLTGDVPSGGGGLQGPSLLSDPFLPVDALLLVVCVLAGLPVGRLLRLPAAHLTGPMLLSAAVHITGLTALRPPVELVAGAQVVVGAALGSRFVGARLRDLTRTGVLSLLSSLVLLAAAAAIAGLVGWATGLPFILLLLAYVPGGVAEMSLVSLALGMDVAFVATHHLVRIALVIAVAPALFRLTRGRAKP